MKILTANIALSLPHMNRLLPVISGHLALHGPMLVRLFLYPSSLKHAQAHRSARRVAYLSRRIDLRPALDVIERSGADLIVLNEVIPQLHRQTLEPFLVSHGYRVSAWGESDHYPDVTITTVVASRLPAVPAPISLSRERHPGGGAGVAALRLENPRITLVGLHLGLADKFPWLYKKEIAELATFIAKEREGGRKVIAAGDWNASAKFIGQFPSFAKLDMVDAAGDTSTCPTFLPWLKPLDHIFIPRGWTSNNVQAIAFGSDHLALSAEIDERSFTAATAR